MVKFLEKCGYIVGNKKGDCDRLLNIFDGVFAVLYCIVSFIILFTSEISLITIILNFIIIFRPILKNMIEFNKVVAMYNNENAQKNDDGLNIITKRSLASITHIIKLAAEICILLLMVLSFLVSYITHTEIGPLFPSIIIIVNLFEDILYVLERLYDARVKIYVSI